MPIDVEHKTELQTIIITYHSPYSIEVDLPKANQAIVDMLEKTDGTLNYIADMSDIDVDFSTLVEGMRAAFKDPNSVFSNPRLNMLTILESDLLKMGAKAVSEQEQYGKIPIQMFDNVDDALAHIKANQ